MRKFYLHSLALLGLVMILIVGNTQKSQAQSKKRLHTKVDPALLELTQSTSLSPTPLQLPTAPSLQLPSPGPAARTQKTISSAQTDLQPFSNSIKTLVLDGYVAMEAIAVDDVNQLRSEMKQLGIKNESVFGGMVSGLLPIEQVDKLSALKQLKFARPTYLKTNIGATTSQGDQVMFSDDAKSTFRITGAGNKIGVLSDSYNTLGGAEAGIKSGDLPGTANPNGYFHPIQVLEDLLPGEGIDEGRAMMEIIHDVAPGAELAFHTAFLGQASFAEGIMELADEGADVIVDDVFYFAEPFFQDGIITQAVDYVASKNVSYFSSAGNSGHDSYEAPFRPVANEIVLPVEFESEEGTVIEPSTYVFHDFDPGPGEDIFQEISFAPGSNSFTISFQWDEPFASVCEACPGSRSDLDVFIALEEDTETILYNLSSYFGNIDSDPFEIVSVGFSNAEPISLYLLIGKYVDGEAGQGPDPNIIKYISFDGGTIVDDPTFSSTVVGHSNGEYTQSVGASFFFRNPLYFPEIYPLPAINDYSSLGGTPILFDTEGNRIEPLVRNNPDFTGPDAGNTTFFIPGLFIGFEVPGTTEPDEFPQFTGTSASAPHVAAVAALMNEMNGERLDAMHINNVLMETATDLDDPATAEFDEGYDFKTGAGFVNAKKAIATVSSLPTVVSLKLVNASTDEVIGELGDRIELSQIEGGAFNIVAEVIDGRSKAESVMFELSGADDLIQVENKEPFALFGDQNGDYRKGSLGIGKYTLTATPFTEDLAEGDKGYALTVSFEVTQSPVASLVLVNTDTDEEVAELTDGDEINLKTTPNFSIVAKPEFEDFMGSIAFYLNGDLVQSENVAPYAIAGDNRGDINPFDLEPGLYTLEVVPYTEALQEGDMGTKLVVNFSVVEVQEVLSLVLVNSDTDEDLISIGNGLIVPLDIFPNVNIRADVNDNEVGSVEFRVNGEVFSVDNEAPFSLGDEVNGDYMALDLPPGEYTVTAVPFSMDNALGTIGIPLSRTLILENNFTVTAFQLWDAANDVAIGPLENGATLDLAELPPINIEAMVDDPEDVGSVEFLLNGERVAIENSAPYAIGGNSGNNYRPFELEVGRYELTAIPYSAKGLKGVSGEANTIVFEVINSIDEQDTEVQILAYPNPVAYDLNLEIKHPTARINYYAIIDNIGRKLSEQEVDKLEVVNIDLRKLDSHLRNAKIFYVRVTSDQGDIQTFPIRRKVE
ncbi:Ig-like domain-containing protein [Porifericola rhodea]|uniref:S8 family serine peptidase n=1 Tax=Porifericola rhodea TaxID=930972 RepID=UPI0026667E3F|nr:S8 family serine peptidase [Porifericola rhodea]WKN31612.1 Ig-like domain-containing protein [Porifericola rhodea]